MNREALDELKQQIPLMVICTRMIGARRGRSAVAMDGAVSFA